jgi:uncharacterized repeat protein (TIGR01451 family)
MTTNSTAQKKRNGGKHTLAALLASAVLWGSALPAMAEIVNSVVVNGKIHGNPISLSATEEVDVIDQIATVTLDKVGTFNDANNNGVADLGETITYTFTARNTGNVTLINVALTDDKVASPIFTLGAGDVAPIGDSIDNAATGWAILAPGDTLTSTASYALTTADLDATKVVNTARIDATTIPGLAVTATDSVTTLLTSASSIALEKTGTLNLGNAVADVGDIITYQFKVTNTGPSTLKNVSVADPLLLLAALPSAERAQSLLQVASIPSDPITTASITTVATPGTAAREPDGWTAPIPQLQTGLYAERRLVRLTPNEDVFRAGDRIGVYFKLTNAGQGPLTDILVVQPGSEAFGSSLDVLAPNTTDSTSLLFTHILTDEDIATGQVELTSGISAQSRNTTLFQTLRRSLSLLDVDAGEDLATASISPATVLSLAPGAQTIFSATYALTQADIDAGQVLNDATVSATNALNVVITADDSATVAVPQAPAVAVEKTAALDLGADTKATVNDLITYTFVIKNTGNTTLNDVRLVDPLPGINIVFTEFDNFAPGDERTFTGTYSISQADIDAGKVENQASASGVSSGGGVRVEGQSNDPATTDPIDKTIIKIPAAPAVALVKNVPTLGDTNTNGVADLGESLTWTFTVHNTGNVKLDNVVVTDRNANVTVTPAAPTNVSLAAGATDTTSFSATYVLTQADIDAGKFENTADVTGDAPDGTKANDTSHPTDEQANGPTTFAIPANPGLAVLKPQPVVVDSNRNGMNDAGDVLNYTISVINTGNVTLRNVVVTDPKANNFTITLPILLPGAVNALSVPVSYAITPADMKTGQIENIAFAETTSGGTAIGDQSDTTDINQDNPTITPIIPSPAIALVKPQPDIIDVPPAGETEGNGATDIGDQLVYSFVVTNTGNTDLNNIVITDALGAVTNTRNTPLEAGDTDNTNFKLVYTLTAADIARGTVTNSADVVALSPANTPARDTSDNDSILQNDPTVTTLANLIDPGIALLKTAVTNDLNSNTITDVGDTITYTFSVTNTGNVALKNVLVTDAKLAAEGVSLQPGNGLIGTLAKGVTSAVLSATHVITQDDVDAGVYDNQASVTGYFGSRPITDLSDDDELIGNDRTVVALSRNPAIAVIKAEPTSDDKNGNGFIDSGDTLTYTFEIHNTGNITLYNIVLTDNNADVVIGDPIAKLVPGAVDRHFTATRLVKDTDALRGEIVNSATVRAAESNGGILSVSDVSDVSSLNGRSPTVTPVVIINPALTKTAARSSITRGEKVEYTIAATALGTGPYDIADLMPPGFTFVTGSATVNGVAIAPAVSGKTLTFANITPGTARKIIVKLSLRAAASTAMQTGEFLNRARLYLNETGQQLADASARVTIKEEAIFDCGEIIGRVFDDLNSNGYMDEGEPGLPGVRVVTVKGLLVTTDKHGRFHVTCADVPNAQIGSNFVMKLDPRTLPAGYSLTSENPRDVRLTRGKITKINFGAAKSRDVGLDLTRDAFGIGLDLKPKFVTGIDRLVGLLRQGKGQLTLTYRCGTYAPIADERLDAVEQLLQAKWQEKGGNKPLKITKRVECGK